MNFWQQLKKPVIGLSPMDGVTDAPFRYIAAKYGEPDVVLTEFINVNGIYHAPEQLFYDFLYHEIERPVVAQIYGNDPAFFYIAAKVVGELGFDGVDINMGCPSKSVAASGSGAALIATPDLALDIVRAVKQGVADWVKDGLKDVRPELIAQTEATKNRLIELGVSLPAERRHIPVSVKTRIGYKDVVAVDWVNTLLKEEPANITMHGRTLKQMYTGSADWEQLYRAADAVAEWNSAHSSEQRITFLGNGDVQSLADADKRMSGNMDGVLIGRASFGHPWIFKGLDFDDVPLQERIAVAIEHAHLHARLKPEQMFVQLRKHLGWYMKGFHGAAQVRAELVRSENAEQVERILAQVETTEIMLDN
ncbi:MAG: putative tRNA-dihydrouridine synthase [candidate division WS6 bacterium OLB20]|uniref:tRNA-dihydrouridine synthase n=1 Tax=candidate division WS6 bacterium OLB20 TaxID=1617426 RepID=A0A136LVM8_9BACT|nr:MAG: putative tRNA-dihydrouridine synthase [candidate division WS6 bacterium OLB20]